VNSAARVESHFCFAATFNGFRCSWIFKFHQQVAWAFMD